MIDLDKLFFLTSFIYVSVDIATFRHQRTSRPYSFPTHSLMFPRVPLNLPTPYTTNRTLPKCPDKYTVLPSSTCEIYIFHICNFI